MNTTDATYDARVLKGVERLNAVKGYDWINMIDPAKLSLISGDFCVLGQIYGGYHTGLSKLGLSSYNNDAEDYGFTTLSAGDSSNKKIEAAWRRYLAFDNSEVLEGANYNATWSYLRVEQMLRINDKTWYVIVPGDIDTNTREFRADVYETPRLYSARNLVKNYKRRVELPLEGQIVKGKDGAIFYIGKDGMAWRIDTASATWQGVMRVAKDFGPLEVLKTASNNEFNATKL